MGGVLRGICMGEFVDDDLLSVPARGCRRRQARAGAPFAADCDRAAGRAAVADQEGREAPSTS